MYKPSRRSADLRANVKMYFDQGMSRKEAINRLGLSNNQMSSISFALGIVWSRQTARTVVKKSAKVEAQSVPRQDSPSDTQRRIEKPTLPLVKGILGINDRGQVAKRSGARRVALESICQSAAFPGEGEDGLTAQDLLALSRLYDK